MDSTWGGDDAAELDEQLAVMSGCLRRIRDLPWWRLSGQRLMDAAGQVETLARAAAGVQVRVAAEIDERGLAADFVAGSTAKLLTQRLAITPGEARGRVIAAKMLLPVDPDPNDPPAAAADTDATDGQGGDGEPGGPAVAAPPVLPVLAGAVDAGEVGADHTRVITRAMRSIPDRVEVDVRAACERLLVDQAKILDANRLRDVAEQIRNITDPDGTLNDLSATDRAELFIGTRRGDGLTPLRGLLDDVTIEHLRQAIEPLAKPRPGGTGEPDSRPAATRRAHAMTEVIGRYLSTDQPPATAGGVRPHAGIIIDLDSLTTNNGGGGYGRGDFIGTLSAPLARLLTCDAAISVMLATHTPPRTTNTDNNSSNSSNSNCGGVVDVCGAGWNGRRIVDAHPEHRLFSAGQRRALAARDGGCAWPGCDTPPGWTVAHHIVFWADGGPTTVGNGVLLCGYHHIQIHLGHWTCRIADDGLPEFIPPRWLDPDQRPRRNHRPHLDNTRRHHDRRRHQHDREQSSSAPDNSPPDSGPPEGSPPGSSATSADPPDADPPGSGTPGSSRAGSSAGTPARPAPGSPGRGPATTRPPSDPTAPTRVRNHTDPPAPPGRPTAGRTRRPAHRPRIDTFWPQHQRPRITLHLRQ